MRGEWSQNGAMPNIQVKNVPPEIHRLLRERAAERHQSLQEFILQSLIDVAETPTDRQVFDLHWATMDRLRGEYAPVTREQILAAVDAGRAGR